MRGLVAGDLAGERADVAVEAAERESLPVERRLEVLERQRVLEDRDVARGRLGRNGGGRRGGRAAREAAEQAGAEQGAAGGEAGCLQEVRAVVAGGSPRGPRARARPRAPPAASPP